MKTINCDVVVVGAGPGGSMAAKTCAKYGLDTVLVERKEKPGKPKLFTTSVNRRIMDYIKIDKKFAVSEVNKYITISAKGIESDTLESPAAGSTFGYAVNRKTFEDELAKLAVKEGAELYTKTRATGLIRVDGQIKGIKAKIDEKEDVEIRSNIVIGADGIESKVGRWAKIHQAFPKKDLWVMEDFLLEDVDVEENTIYQWMRYEGTPGVAFWLSPHGDRRWALTVFKSYKTSYPEKRGELFNAFAYFFKNDPIFSNAKIIDRGGGVVPMLILKKLTTDGVMLVGDAASQAEKMYAGGCLHAMDAGVMAGETAVEAHEEGDFSSNLLSRYEKRWKRLHGENDLLKFYFRKFLLNMSDEGVDGYHQSLRDNNGKHTFEWFMEFSKSSRFMSKLFDNFRKEGLDVMEFYFVMSHFKQNFENYWDTLIQ